MARPRVTEERSRQILDAVEVCVARHGLEGASLQRIAEQAGLARGLLRHHVGNREALIEAMAERFLVKSAAELAELTEAKARNHPWLGDRLRLKNRYKAAAKQYRKAAKHAGHATTIIQAKLGHALLQQGQLEAAITELKKPLQHATRYVLLHLYLGEAYLRLGRLDKAREHLEEAVALNPFDISVHGHLATVYTKMKLQARAAEERKLHNRVRVHMQ